MGRFAGHAGCPLVVSGGRLGDLPRSWLLRVAGRTGQRARREPVAAGCHVNHGHLRDHGERRRRASESGASGCKDRPQSVGPVAACCRRGRAGLAERVQDRSADGKPSVYRLTVPAGLDRGCPPARQEMSSGVTGVSQDGTGGVVDSDTTPSSTPDLTPSRTPTDTPSAGSCQHPDYCGDALCGLVDFMPPD